MNVIASLQGLKFPDEMVTRFFFKNGLHLRKGRVLELGCGNANNLTLFAAYGWDCMGLDINPSLISQGLNNFSALGFSAPRLDVVDMNKMLPSYGQIDVLLMPSSLYYVKSDRASEIIKELEDTLNPQSYVFCGFRTPEDYRYGKGDALDDNTYRLKIHETSEYDCLVCFYNEQEMKEILRPINFEPETISVMSLVFDNIGCDAKMIRNSDLVIWGRTL